MRTATFVRQHNGNGDGRVYRLSPPLQIKNYDGEVESETEYVWVSAADAMFSGPETYIFACDEGGEVTSWLELEGSFRGALDHEEALRGAGYEVVS
jgi:hypothetical protein